MSYAPFRPLTYNYGVGTAFGAVSGFNGAATWSDWLAGASGNNAAGMRAADAIRAALGGIGYGPFTVGVSWGTSADKAGFSKFVSDNGLTAGPNGSWWPTQQALLKLEEAAAQGGNQGGGPIQNFHVVDGQQIPGASPASKAAMTGTTIGLLVGGALILGFLAYRAKKKDTRSGGGYGDGTGPGYMFGPGRATRYAANRSRKRAKGRRAAASRSGRALPDMGPPPPAWKRPKAFKIKKGMALKSPWDRYFVIRSTGGNANRKWLVRDPMDLVLRLSEDAIRTNFRPVR